MRKETASLRRLWMLTLAMLVIEVQPDAAASNENADVAAKQFAAAPLDFQLLDLQGKPRAFGEWSGQAVLINYWASWCAPCLREMPDLDAFSKSQAGIDGGVRVVGVAADEVDAVRAFLKRVPVSFPILIETIPDGGRGSASLFGDSFGVLPYSVLLDGQGRVVRSKMGPVSREELESWVNDAPVAASE